MVGSNVVYRAQFSRQIRLYRRECLVLKMVRKIKEKHDLGENKPRHRKEHEKQRGRPQNGRLRLVTEF